MLTIAIAEEVPVGTLIGSIPTKAGFTYRYFQSTFLFLSFIFGCVIFNSESTITFNPTRLNQPSSHFTLSPTSGELRTSSRLDREGRDGADSRDLVALSSSPTYPIEASHPLLNLFSLNKRSEGEPIMWVRGGVEDMSEHLGRH